MKYVNSSKLSVERKSKLPSMNKLERNRILFGLQRDRKNMSTGEMKARFTSKPDKKHDLQHPLTNVSCNKPPLRHYFYRKRIL